MNLYFNRLYREWSRYAVIAIIIISRLIQSAYFAPSGVPAYVGQYFKFYLITYTSFVLPMVYCIWIFGSFTQMQDEKIILRSDSRFKAFLNQMEYSFTDALLFSALLNATSLPFVFVQCGSAVNQLLFYLLCFLLQLLFFSLCSLLYFVIYLLFTRSYVSFIAVVAYGLFDFLITYGNTGKLWYYIGTGLLFVTNVASAVTNIRFLIAANIVLALISAFIYSKKDFLGRIEAKL